MKYFIILLTLFLLNCGDTTKPEEKNFFGTYQFKGELTGTIVLSPPEKYEVLITGDEIFETETGTFQIDGTRITFFPLECTSDGEETDCGEITAGQIFNDHIKHEDFKYLKL